MAARKAFDRRPGPLPDIQMDVDSVTYAFDVGDLTRVRLVIRCDAHGEVWASIAAIPGPPPDSSPLGEHGVDA